MSSKPLPGRLGAALFALLALGLAAPTFASAQESASTEPSVSIQRRVDVNVAGEQELQVLPQVGPVVARRIVEYRKAVGPFRKVEELLNVKGIGRKTLERLKPLITLGSADPDLAGATPAGTGS